MRQKPVAPPVLRENKKARDGSLLPEDQIVRWFEYDMITKYGSPAADPSDPLKLDPKGDLDCGNHRSYTCGAQAVIDAKTGKTSYVPTEVFEVGVWYVPYTAKLDLLEMVKVKGLEKSVKACVFTFTWVKE
jgi:hypothetical protein